MRYVSVTAAAGPEVMTLADGDAPTPAAGEVLIRVAAAGVNRPDVMQRAGLYPPPADASPILGLEVAGTVIAVGEGVDSSWLQRDVCALVNGGGYAEQAVAPVGQCLPIPKGWSAVEAASLPETFFTVWTNVFDRGGLKAGDSFLVHGGSSGIGSAAIQMAKHLGARVFATAGSDEKCRYCEDLGAELAVNYRDQDFVEVLREATDQNGIDVILDMVGGEYIERNLQVAADRGRIVNIAFLQGPKVQINMLPVMLKRLTLTGSTLRPRTRAEKAAIAEALHANVWPLLESGKIKPTLAASFSLADAAEAHRLMESSQHMGNIVLEVQQ